jgi:hypothetical protein
MDIPEIDRRALLEGIEGAETRARTAREFGLLDEEFDDLACGGSGPEALLNRAILDGGPPGKASPGPRARKRKSARKPRKCPACGYINA